MFIVAVTNCSSVDLRLELKKYYFELLYGSESIVLSCYMVHKILQQFHYEFWEPPWMWAVRMK